MVQWTPLESKKILSQNSKSDFYISSGPHEITIAPGDIAKSKNVVNRVIDDSVHVIDDTEEDNMDIDSHISTDMHDHTTFLTCVGHTAMFFNINHTIQCMDIQISLTYFHIVRRTGLQTSRAKTAWICMGLFITPRLI
jgi:hypothetical protein